MASITSVAGTLAIQRNPLLLSLAGLENISEVRGNLAIGNNENLSDLQGLIGLQVGGKFFERGSVNFQNPLITDLDGLSNLKNTYLIYIAENARLRNIDALTNISDKQHTIQIVGNESLVNLNGLSSLTYVFQHLRIEDNPALEDIGSLLYMARGMGIYCEKRCLNKFGRLEWTDRCPKCGYLLQRQVAEHKRPYECSADDGLV